MFWRLFAVAVCAAIIAAGAADAHPLQAPRGLDRAALGAEPLDGLVRPVQGRGVCCNRGGRDFVTTRRDCFRRGGSLVTERRCDVGAAGGGERVCCARGGRRDFFTTRRRCRRVGGRTVAIRRCVRPGPIAPAPPRNDRVVCCDFDGGDAFMPLSRCKAIGGGEVANRRCDD